MKRLLFSVALGAVLLAFTAPSSSAQITGTLGGVVADAQGGVLPGVTVTATSPNLHRSDVFTATGADGHYQLVGLPAGTYELTAALSGFRTETLKNIRVGLNEAVTLDIKLQLASVQETVTVTGAAPLVEVRKSSLSQEVTSETIESMPLNGRQFLDLVGLAAGTAPRPAVSQQGSGVTVFGERSVTNSFLVDGMENNDDYTRDFAEFYIQDVIQEFKVELGGYKAEFGRASGAVANVVTKSGTNEVRGRGFVFGRSDSLDSSNVSAQKPPELQRTDSGGYLGGPIAQNRAWFFGAVEVLREKRGSNFDLSRVPQVIKDGWFTPTVKQEDFSAKPDIQNLTYFGKVNHQFNSQNQIFATTNINIGHRKNLIPSPEQAFGTPPPGSIALPSTASDIGQNSYSATARYTTFVTQTSFLESSFRYLRNRYQENTSKTIGAEQLFPGTFNALRQVTFWLSNASSIGILDRKNERYEGSETLSLYRDARGHHDIKVGLDYNRVRLDRDFLAPQTMIVANTFYESDYKSLDIGAVELQRAITLTLGDKTRTKVQNNVWGLFGQDSWQLKPGLTLNLGLRYDYASLFSDANKNLAPRVGLAWDPNHDGKTVLRTSYGLYYDQNILELATSVPELGGLQFTSWSQQLIPRGASTFDNPAIGAFGPLQSGGTRWLSNPAFFSAILPLGQVRQSGSLSITGQGKPYVVYEMLGIPVVDPKNPPVLSYNNISKLTGGRLTPDQAVAILNSAFPGPGFGQFTWDNQPPAGSILKDRYLMFRFRTAGPGISRTTTLQHPEKTPFTRSFNVGFEREIVRDLSADFEVFVRRSSNLLAGRVVNLRETPVSASCLGNTVDGQPCNNQVQYIGFLDSNVLTVSLRKRMAHRHSFLANYTYTHAVDNFSTLRVPPIGGQTNFLLNNHPELDVGRSLNTPDHVFVFSGTLQAPYGIDVSGILRSSSGARFNAAGAGADSDGDEIFDNRLLGTEKGAFKTDPFVQLDVRFAKEFRFGSHRNLIGMVDVFNLTNRANPFRVNTAFGPTIGQTIEPLPGREIQVGIRLDF